MPRRRSRRLALLTLVLVLSLGLSALLARVFSADGAERSAITSLIQAEARGDATSVMAQVRGCAASAECVTRARDVARALAHPGRASILLLDPSTGFTLSGTVGSARVAWHVGGSLPIVQCVQVRRGGNALTAFRIELLRFTRRLRSDADCPTPLR